MSYHKAGTNDNLTLAYIFPWTVADSPVAVRSLSASHFPFTTSGLMIECVAPVSLMKVCSLPFMYPHAIRLLLFCYITDMETVVPSLVGASTCPSVLARFSLKGTLAKMVGSSPVFYSLMVRRTLTFSMVPYSFFENDQFCHS